MVNTLRTSAKNSVRELIDYTYVLFQNDRRTVKLRRLRWEVLIQCVWDVTDFTEAQMDNNVKFSVIEKCQHVNWARLLYGGELF